MDDLTYDVIIAGCGPAGLACAISLADYGKKSLILERKEKLDNIVCGDGLTGHCMKVLTELNIHDSDLLSLGAKKLLHNICKTDHDVYKKRFVADEHSFDYSIGLSRDVFDNYLLHVAKSKGVQVVFGCKVKNIQQQGDQYLINSCYRCKDYVIATGSGRNPVDRDKSLKNMPVGVSSRIIGTGRIKDESLYFFRLSSYGDGYAWIFPVGENKWNIGVWSSNYQRRVAQLYRKFEAYVKNNLVHVEGYDRHPKGSVLGCGDQNSGSGYHVIGDAANLVDTYSGEGISFAIESGILKAKEIALHEPYQQTLHFKPTLTDEGMKHYHYWCDHEDHLR